MAVTTPRQGRYWHNGVEGRISYLNKPWFLL